jgi:hypothetical protein
MSVTLASIGWSRERLSRKTLSNFSRSQSWPLGTSDKTFSELAFMRSETRYTMQSGPGSRGLRILYLGSIFFFVELKDLGCFLLWFLVYPAEEVNGPGSLLGSDFEVNGMQ